MMLKADLLERCQIFAKEKLNLIETVIKANQKSLEQESKSSAGDKHETGRAMLHLEMEKASQQFKVVQQMMETLGRIDIHHISGHVKLGSLVTTDQGRYFIAVSAGELTIDNKQYYAISPASPIGRLLIGKVEGETVLFGTRTIKIESIT